MTAFLAVKPQYVLPPCPEGEEEETPQPCAHGAEEQEQPAPLESERPAAARGLKGQGELNVLSIHELKCIRKRRAARLSGAEGEGRLAEALRLTELKLLCTECNKRLPASSFSQTQLEGQDKARGYRRKKATEEQPRRRCIACVAVVQAAQCVKEACLVCGQEFSSRSKLFRHVELMKHWGDEPPESREGRENEEEVPAETAEPECEEAKSQEKKKGEDGRVLARKLRLRQAAFQKAGPGAVNRVAELDRELLRRYSVVVVDGDRDAAHPSRWRRVDLVAEGEQLSNEIDERAARLLKERSEVRSAAVGPLLPLEKKKVDIAGKLYVAPLTTVGNLPFRRIVKGLGADITCSEMALASSLLEGRGTEWSLLRRHESEDCFGIQLSGSEATVLAACCDMLEAPETGLSFDFVDINCGCPIDAVCSRGAGAGLCWRPELERVVRSCSAVLSRPFSLKLRLGLTEEAPLAPGLIQRMRAWGDSVAWVTCHGRTRNQRYTRQADWDMVTGDVLQAASGPLEGTAEMRLWDVQSCCREEGTKPLPPIPLIGNGDVLSHQDWYDHIEANPGLASAMVARGALIKPWLCTEIKERRDWDISAGERFDILKNFVSHGLEHWGADEQGVHTTRHFLLEWLSFLHRYVPLGLLEQPPQRIHQRPPRYVGRSDLETLMASSKPTDWVKISEMLLGPVTEGFRFEAKHRSSAY